MGSQSGQPVMSAAEVDAFLEREFPQMLLHGKLYAIEAVEPLACRMRLTYHDSQLRPGGTISGPAMMALADLALYVAILGSIGPVGLAVTTHLSINFLRKPEKRDLVADCRILKLGRRLAVGETALRSAGRTELVAHATGTYSIPPDARSESRPEKVTVL